MVITMQHRTQQKVNTSVDTVVTVIFWLNEPSLWPWLWRQQLNLFEQHSGSYWCISIPRWVTKRYTSSENMVPDSGQTFTETLSLTCYCAHDFEQSNPASRQNPDRHMDRIPIYPHFTTGWEILKKGHVNAVIIQKVWGSGGSNKVIKNIF